MHVYVSQLAIDPVGRITTLMYIKLTYWSEFKFMIKYVPLYHVWIFKQDAGTTLAAVDEVKEYVSKNAHYKIIYMHEPW